MVIVIYAGLLTITSLLSGATGAANSLHEAISWLPMMRNERREIEELVVAQTGNDYLLY